MIEKIEDLPIIPAALRQSALQKSLVPFIGAGVSKLAGCPGWEEFSNATLDFFVKNGKLSHAQLDQISSVSSRVKLSLALELEKQHGVQIDFEGLLQSSADRKKLGEDVYRDILQLGTTIVTTNYDSWLHQKSPPSLSSNEGDSILTEPVKASSIFYKKEDINIANLTFENTIFHLHGSVKDRDSMVVTTVQYLERYSSHRINGGGNHENSFLSFLEHLFKVKNVLFIGYGLAEFEILEYVIQKGGWKQADSDEEPRHYVLQGFFTHQLELARYLESYYRQFGIGLLTYSRDECDWDQLARVIEYLVNEIPPGPGLELTVRDEMAELLT